MIFFNIVSFEQRTASENSFRPSNHSMRAKWWNSTWLRDGDWVICTLPFLKTMVAFPIDEMSWILLFQSGILDRLFSIVGRSLFNNCDRLMIRNISPRSVLVIIWHPSALKQSDIGWFEKCSLNRKVLFIPRVFKSIRIPVVKACQSSKSSGGPQASCTPASVYRWLYRPRTYPIIFPCLFFATWKKLGWYLSHSKC